MKRLHGCKNVKLDSSGDGGDKGIFFPVIISYKFDILKGRTFHDKACIAWVKALFKMHAYGTGQTEFES